MRAGEVGWRIALVGLPFAPFLFRPHLDLWNSQALWMQAWVIGLLAWMLWQGARPLGSRALACWLAWNSLHWLWQWTVIVVIQKGYPTLLLFGWMHLLTIVGFYWAFTALLTREQLPGLLRALAWSAWVLMSYGWVQVAGLDQFFRSLYASHDMRDTLVGTMGNPTHFATHLALLLPLVLLQPGKRWWACAAGILGVIVLTKSTSGCLVALTVVTIWAWTRAPWRTLAFLFLFGGGCLAFFGRMGLDAAGRWEAWSAIWTMVQERPVTGLGLGYLMEWSKTVPMDHFLYRWRHAHNEYLQVMLEQGLLGLG